MTTVTQSLERAVQHHRAGELEQSERLCQDILRVDPGHADALNLLGVSLHQRRQSDAAVHFLSRAVAANNRAAMYHNNLGAAYRSAGRLEQAIDSFRNALRIDGGFAGAHYNLAMALESLGRTEEAVASYREAIRNEPKFAEAYNNLGRLFASLERRTEAIECLQQYVKADPGSARALYNLANIYAADRQFARAVETYQLAIAIAPGVAEIHNNLGAVLKEMNDFAAAALSFERALELKPDFADARSNLATVNRLASGAASPGGKNDRSNSPVDGSRSAHHVSMAAAMRHEGRYDEAEAHYRAAIEADPNLAEAHFGLGFVELSNGRHDRACECFETTLKIDPRHVGALTNLGSIYSGRNELEQALDCYRNVLKIRPDDAINSYNLASVLKDLWQLDEAERLYRQAIKTNPEFIQACINLGVVLQRQGKMQEALGYHRRAVELDSTDAEARFHHSLALLHAGDFERGWDEYEWRWKYEASTRDFGMAPWDGTRLENCKLLVYAEQGVGDEIMFASCLPEVIGQTTACVVECDPRLVPLFARSFPLADVVSRPCSSEGTPAARKCDTQVALGSLPRFLRRRLEDFPKQQRYLHADPDAVAKWRERYANLGVGLNVGISWKGGNNPSIRKSRSSELDAWSPILSIPGVQFVNLQYGQTAAEMASFERASGLRIHHWKDADPLVDLDDFAAQVAALDLVISVDNSTVHMAGALGVDVWTLLSYSPNWRWMLGRDDSPWYSTMRLFRQPEHGNWAAVFANVTRELATFAARSDNSSLEIWRGIARTSDEASLKTPLPLRERQDFGELSRAGEGEASQRAQNARNTSSASKPTTDADRERKKYETIWTHNDYRRFSPGLHDADKVPLIDTLRKAGVRTILDAGCGSGKLMQRLMTQHASEFDVHGFDISSNCLDPFFNDIVDEVLTLGCLWDANDFCIEYDAIICTDVLEHIPTEHIPKVLANFRRCTRKICYLAIALFPDNFGPALLGEPLHLTVKPPVWWFEEFAKAGLKIESYGVEKNSDGREMWLHAFVSRASNANVPAAPSTTTATKTVLHVGCGPRNAAGLHERFRTAEWKEVRLDIDPRVEPDVVASLTDMRVVKSASVDAVWSSHNIEHLHAHEVPLALAEFHRVLKPGGTALVTLPDLQEIARYVVADKLEEVAYISPAGPITPLDCIFGFGKPIAAGNAFMAHKTGFTASTLKRALTDAGFVDIRTWSATLNLWAEARK